MPVCLVEAAAAMLPRLQAEEQMRTIAAVGTGFGGGEGYMRELRATAEGGVPSARKLRPPSAADFGAMGIKVKVVEKKA
jgi:hypothetical protein